MPNHTVRKKNIPKTDQLDRICRACGQVWTKTVRRFWRTYRKQGVWLSKYDMHNWICTETIRTDTKGNGFEHPDMEAFAGKRENAEVPELAKTIGSQTRQETVGSFFDALKTWRKAKDQGMAEGFRPPYKPKKFYKAQWKYQSIKRRGDHMRLTCGRGPDPVMIEWPHPLPRHVEIGWDHGNYEVRAKYNDDQDLPEGFIRTREPVGDKTAAIDPGEIYLASVFDGDSSYIINGGRLRDLRQTQNREKRKFAGKIDRKKKGSRRFWKLVQAKNSRLEEIRNKIKDLLHKMSTRLVEEIWSRGCSKIVIGDLSGIRTEMDYGSKMNQRLHQWAFRQFKKKIEYKADRYNIETEDEREKDTSSVCPHCGEHKTEELSVNDRLYRCTGCGFEGHRDIMGAANIRARHLEGSIDHGHQDGPLPNPKIISFDSHMECVFEDADSA